MQRDHSTQPSGRLRANTRLNLPIFNQLSSSVLLLGALCLSAACSSSGSVNHQALAGSSGGSTGSTTGSGSANATATKTAGKTSPGSAAPAGSPAAPGLPAAPAPGLAIRTAVRNYQSINATMAALTGVPTSNADVAATFAAESVALPTDQDPTAFIGSNQVAVFKLAVEYCNALVADSTKLAAVVGALPTTGTPATVFSATNSPALATAFITQFWGTNLTSLPPIATSVSTMTGLITDILSTKTNPSASLTPALLTTMCTSALAAAPVTMY